MKIEHKLSPAIAMYAQQTMEALRQKRKDYLATLVQARELEMESMVLQRGLEQALALVQQTEHLPAPVKPYTLSEDCSALVGEVEDLPKPDREHAIVDITASEPDGAKVNGLGSYA